MNEKNNTAVWALVGVLSFMAITSLSVAPKSPSTEFSKNILASVTTSSASVTSSSKEAVSNKELSPTTKTIKTSSPGSVAATHDQFSMTHYVSSDSHYLESETHRVPSYFHRVNSDRHSFFSASHTETSVSHNRNSDSHNLRSVSHTTGTKYHLEDTTTLTSPDPDVVDEFTVTDASDGDEGGGAVALSVPGVPEFPPGSTHDESTNAHDGISNTHSLYSWNHSVVSKNHNTNSTSHGNSSYTHFFNTDSHEETSEFHRLNTHRRFRPDMWSPRPRPTTRPSPRLLPADMAMGDSGADVETLQAMLQSEGLFSGEITGYFGPVTFNAVKLFQAKYEIKELADGYVGELTRSVLNERPY